MAVPVGLAASMLPNLTGFCDCKTRQFLCTSCAQRLLVAKPAGRYVPGFGFRLHSYAVNRFGTLRALHIANRWLAHFFVCFFEPFRYLYMLRTFSCAQTAAYALVRAFSFFYHLKVVRYDSLRNAFLERAPHR